MFMHILVNIERGNGDNGNKKESRLDSPMERKGGRIWNPTDLVLTPFPHLLAIQH